MLTNTNPIASTRIITSIKMDCVNRVFLSLALALEIEIGGSKRPVFPVVLSGY